MNGLVDLLGDQIAKKVIGKLKAEGIDTHEMPTNIMDALERIGVERRKQQQKE